MLFELLCGLLVVASFLSECLNPGSLSVLPSELCYRVSDLQQFIFAQPNGGLLKPVSRTFPLLAVKVRPVAVGPLLPSPPLLDLKVLQVLVYVEGNDSGCPELVSALDPGPVRWRA